MMKKLCAECATPIVRGYKLSAKRWARPMYCCSECELAGRYNRAMERRKSYFWSKVAISEPNNCWLWKGYCDPNGYGRYGNLLAPRIAYELTHSSIPDGMCVCHTCDNPPCVNPKHLWVGTQSDNVADMDAKGRRIPGTRYGEASNKAKLTAAQAIEIFRSQETSKALAGRFGVTATAIYLIRRGRNWAHITQGVAS